jgi:hypothetical protein
VDGSIVAGFEMQLAVCSVDALSECIPKGIGLLNAVLRYVNFWSGCD